MSFTNKEKDILKRNGYSHSAYDLDKLIRDNTWVKRGGNKTNWGGISTNFGISNSQLDKKSKK